MKFKLTMATTATAAIILAGCGGGSNGSDAGSGSGGGSGSATTTGTFKDAIVQNLGYKCASSETKFTTSEGKFTCNTGDKVEFFVGAYSLGTVAVKSGVTTPYSLYPSNFNAALNVARILQTIEDATDGTIAIPDGFNKLDAVTDTKPGDADFNATIEKELPNLVSAEDATEHMVNSLLVGSKWEVVENTTSSTCQEEIPTKTYILTFASFDISTNTIVMHTPIGDQTGNYNPATNKITYTGQIPEDGGTTTVNTILTPNASFETISGNSTWTWSDGADSCSGTTQITATWQ